MHAARASLSLPRLDVIHAGEHISPLTEGIRAVAFSCLAVDVQPL